MDHKLWFKLSQLQNMAKRSLLNLSVYWNGQQKIERFFIFIYFYLRGLKIRNDTFFSDPKMFFSQIVEQVEKGPLANFERFWHSRTFLKKILKIQNQAKKFSRPVSVGWKCVGEKLVSVGLLQLNLDGTGLTDMIRPHLRNL